MTAITRREAIKGAAGAALATGAIAVTPGVVLGGSPSPAPALPKIPADAEGVCFSLVAEERRELTFLLKGGIFRDATDEELTDHDSRNPFRTEWGKPVELREFFTENDGELFALFAERHQHRAAQDNEGRAANLQAICETPAITDAGVLAAIVFPRTPGIIEPGRSLRKRASRRPSKKESASDIKPRQRLVVRLDSDCDTHES